MISEQKATAGTRGKSPSGTGDAAASLAAPGLIRHHVPSRAASPAAARVFLRVGGWKRKPGISQATA